MPQVTITLSETDLQLARLLAQLQLGPDLLPPSTEEYLAQVLHERLCALYERHIAVEPAEGEGNET